MGMSMGELALPLFSLAVVSRRERDSIPLSHLLLSNSDGFLGPKSGRDVHVSHWQ